MQPSAQELTALTMLVAGCGTPVPCINAFDRDLPGHRLGPTVLL
jgi:hypothetical protein